MATTWRALHPATRNSNERRAWFVGRPPPGTLQSRRRAFPTDEQGSVYVTLTFSHGSRVHLARTGACASAAYRFVRASEGHREALAAFGALAAPTQAGTADRGPRFDDRSSPPDAPRRADANPTDSRPLR